MNHGPHNSPWNAERDDQLRALHADGLRYSQIAAELGLSRNACIGRAARIGLRERPHTAGLQSRPHRASKKPMKRGVHKLIRSSTHSNGVRMIETIEQDLPMSRLCAADIPLEQRKQLLDLNSNDCRWPYGDPGKPDFFFCGAPADCQPYCRMHTRVAYTVRANPRPYIPMRNASAR